MKKVTVVGIVLALSAIGVVAWQVRKHHSPVQRPLSLSASSILGVDQYMRNVDQYQGAVTVEGVVSAIAPDKGVLVLIDRSEWEECQSVDCAKLMLPVRWQGEMPVVKAAVHVEGQAQQIDGKLIFVAGNVTRVPLEARTPQ